MLDGQDHAGVIKSSVDEIDEFAAINVISSTFCLKHILRIVCSVFPYRPKHVLHVLR